MRVYETNGQYLYDYLLGTHLHGGTITWKNVATSLRASHRGDEWAEAFQEMTSLQLMRRLIVAGKDLFDENDLEESEVQIKHSILDTMIVHWDSASDIYERLVPAIRSSRSEITDPIRSEAEEFARRVMPYCYLCGVQFDFAASDHLQFTLDHIWPRAYGGNSDLENLLGACKSCNETKGDSASWALYPVQAFVSGYKDKNMERIPKRMRFAIQARKAKYLSDTGSISLRDAYIHLGRPDIPAFTGGETAGDMYNVQFVERKEEQYAI